MARTTKYTNDQIETALRAAGGIYTIAAATLESATGKGCSPNTVKNAVKRSPKLQAVYDEIVFTNVDIAEAGLLKLMRGTKEQPPNLTAIIFYLKCKGKDRGYVERAEITGKGGGPVKVETKPDLSALSMNDLRALRAVANDNGSNGAAQKRRRSS